MSEIIDNRAHRIRTLKQIIRRLHEGRGVAPEEVRAQLREIVRRTDATEVAAMEQELMAEGVSAEEVRSMCDLHAQVLKDIMEPPAPSDVPPGHPVDTFRRENRALAEVVARARKALEAVSGASGGALLPAALDLRKVLNDLWDVDKHYARKENLLFSVLEKHGVTGPTRVMWGKDDEVRNLLKEAGRGLAEEPPDPAKIRAAVEAALEAVEGMIFKEENILLPMSMATLSEDDWASIWRDSPRHGWCLVEPLDGYRPEPDAASPAEPSLSGVPVLEFPTGTLSLNEMIGLFRTLPVDLTFVDADDRVRFFSEGGNRIFVRSRTILGRKVQNCHPPGSLHVVEKILADFRAGARDAAEFWIDFRGKFVHIRYFAVRDPEGRYLGCLETTQDLTPLRALQGERRLLENTPQG
jgi:hypothetical protein